MNVAVFVTTLVIYILSVIYCSFKAIKIKMLSERWMKSKHPDDLRDYYEVATDNKLLIVNIISIISFVFLLLLWFWLY